MSQPQTTGRESKNGRGTPDSGPGAQLGDRMAVTSDLIRLIWQHKLWWVIPLVLATIVLGVLLVLESTPVGPLLYPVF